MLIRRVLSRRSELSVYLRWVLIRRILSMSVLRRILILCRRVRRILTCHILIRGILIISRWKLVKLICRHLLRVLILLVRSSRLTPKLLIRSKISFSFLYYIIAMFLFSWICFHFFISK